MPGRDPLFAPWAAAQVGEPVLVRTVSGQPSYWTVPVELEGRAIGFVRVSLDGRALAAGARYRDPNRTATAPALVTGVSAEDARRSALANESDGSTAGEPVYVHDGPPGREAWLVEVHPPGQAVRRVFVTAAGTYPVRQDGIG
jgi:hypothetical protein